MRGIEAQAPPDRFCELGSHAVGKRAAGATLSVAVFAHYQGAVGPQASQALIGSKQRNGPSAAGAGPSLGSVMCRGYQALSTNG